MVPAMCMLLTERAIDRAVINETSPEETPVITRFAVLAFLTLSPVAFAAALPKGTVVRVEGSGIEAGWFQGKITVTSQGCTMVTLDKPTKDGYTMLALIALKSLQRQQGAAWVTESLDKLKAGEPKKCLEEGSD